MSTFLFSEIIFGPVSSRRLGVSLGINLLPTNSKLCNFNCIYCECGWNRHELGEKDTFHERETVYEMLEYKLAEMQANNEPLDVITFAGNGEPTLHPYFAEIIDDTIFLRNKYFPKVRIAVLSNATRIEIPKIRKALLKIDQNILKLDSAFNSTVKLLNNPQKNFSVEKLVENLNIFKGKLTIQTMFVRGNVNEKIVDNTTEKELLAWEQLIAEIKPQNVMIYTIARETPLETLNKVSLEELKNIASRIEKYGIEVQVSG